MNDQTDPTEIFRTRLKTARELRKWNQGELATAAKLPASSIAHFEGGKRKPSFDNLRRLATALDVPTDYLLGLADEPVLSASGDTLFRHGSKLTGHDRELAEDFLKMLADRNKAQGDGEDS